MIKAILYWLVVYLPVLWLLSPFLFPRVYRRITGWIAERSLEGEHGIARDDARLSELGRSVAAAAGLSGAKFHLLLGDQLNAVALPNGKIYVWMGLYLLVRDRPDQLAGVLAHELGHLECDHFLRRVRFAFALQAAFFWTGRGWLGGFARRAVSAVLTSGYSRTQEREADRAAVRILEKSGRSAAGLAELLDHLGGLEGDATLHSTFLGSHPACRERATAIRGWMRTDLLPSGA